MTAGGILVVAGLLLCLAGVSGGEGGLEPLSSCPPPTPVRVCEPTCSTLSDCPPPYLCCPTSCGGTLCTVSVTPRRNTRLEKPGSCPSVAGGPWICSNTCSGDGDCRRHLKCCPNRCGALTCRPPQ